MPTTFRQNVSQFHQTIYLMVGNVSSVSNVKYWDTTNTQITVDLSTVTIDLDICPTPVYLMDAYPAVHPQRHYPASVEFIAGYADSSHVPADIKAGIMAYAAHLYRDRDGSLPVPQGFLDLCQMNHTGISNSWGN
ncbi:head-tail connector protein [Zavarzinella formosa]|uniref:hypothetical protein n=1 Tax=Zavarzinella formosa TaxID=360055 RepID=UPI0012F96A4D|nr:hypothetical protein [Zavarzinella formosa]